MNLFDSANYPEGMPSRLVVGDRWVWKRTDLTDYPASAYALRYVLRLFGTGATEIAIDANEDGNDYLIEVASATTAAYTAGWYEWQLYIIRSADSERIMLDRGRVELLPDRDESTADPRNHNRIMLEALEATLQGKATRDQTSYSIGDRSIARMSPSEIQEWYDIYRRRVRDDEREEQAEMGKGGGHRVRVRLHG